MLRLRCHHHDLEFLIDTGADFSVVPKSFRKRLGFVPTEEPRKLLAANLSKIPVYGSYRGVLSLPSLPSLNCMFLVADVAMPILGADFIFDNGLIIDLRKNSLTFGKLAPALKNASTVALVSNSNLEPHKSRSLQQIAPLFTACPHNYSDSLRKLLHEHSQLFATSLRNVPPVAESASNRLNVYHHVITTGPPLTCLPRRLPPEKDAAVAKEINLMLQQGIIRPSSSPWASPIHVVPKSDGGWRPCGDYRRLNIVSQKDNYPLPNIFDFAGRLHGARLFSHLDLLKGFWQVAMNPADIQKTAISTTRGLYEFIRMPFGLKNSPNTFQRLMDELVRGLPGVFVYMDDLLVFGKDQGQHLSHLRQLFSRLEKFGMKLAPEKCSFEKKELTFLGFHVSSEGIRPPPERV